MSVDPPLWIADCAKSGLRDKVTGMNLLLSVLTVMAGMFGDHDQAPECLALGGLDLVRAHAYAQAEPMFLKRVYVDGADHADRVIIRDYRKRGLRVDGAVLHRASCAVVDRSVDRVELNVVDSLGSAVVSSPAGRLTALPRDGASERFVTLTDSVAGWRISGVR